ncbi:MAG: hypothetical protein HY698_17505 [Deltaproteobacteria bacterium]|nr:hypothetical protein [Deltaproteobacteria bacterium]
MDSAPTTLERRELLACAGKATHHPTTTLALVVDVRVGVGLPPEDSNGVAISSLVTTPADEAKEAARVLDDMGGHFTDEIRARRHVNTGSGARHVPGDLAAQAPCPGKAHGADVVFWKRDAKHDDWAGRSWVRMHIAFKNPNPRPPGPRPGGDPPEMLVQQAKDAFAAFHFDRVLSCSVQ